MPELPEVERYRLLLHEHGLRRPVVEVDAGDAWYLDGGLTAGAVRDALVGRSLVASRRHGKLLLAGTGAGGPVLGLRFGMSGQLLIDGRSAVGRLLYAPVDRHRRWDRFVLHFGDGGDLRMHDPRRLGGVAIDPDESRLGPDALAASLDDVRIACRATSVALKARLLDQSKLAGIGNLAADEILWRSGLSPLRAAGDLDVGELRRLQRRIGTTLRMLIRRGGSHTGDLVAARHPGGVCPADGAPLRRDTVGGRTTWWCPLHQV